MKLMRNLALASLYATVLLSQDAQAQDILGRLKDILAKLVSPAQIESTLQRKDNETLVPSSDRMCNSLDHSYTLTESLTELGLDELRCNLVNCPAQEKIPTDNKQLEHWLYDYSKKHVWLPVAVENVIGASLLSDMQKDGIILERGSPITDRLYSRVDQSLEIARRAYSNVPYNLKIYIIDITEQVNAQAAPGGYMFVTRSAATDLDDDALMLVLGHEVAHLAKRHLSKQLQQRLMDTNDGVGLFRRVIVQKLDIKQQTNETSEIIKRLQCSFAQYDRDQETQADSCAARVLVESGGDPVTAWDDFVRVRGSVVMPAKKDKTTSNAACYASLETHPEDRDRANNIRAAAAQHRARLRAN